MARSSQPLLTLLVLVVIAASSARPRHPNQRRHNHGGEGRPSHKQLEQDRVEAFKAGILTRMGLSGPPTVLGGGNATAEESRAALRLYRQSVEQQRGQVHQLYEEDDTNFIAKRFQSFTASNMGVWSSIDEPEIVRLHIPLDIQQPADGSLELRVPSSTLHLYRMASRPQNMIHTRTVNLQVRVNVYQLLEDPTSVKHPLRRLLASHLVSLSEPAGWETFDITEAVSSWIGDPQENYGLEISAGDKQSLSEVITLALTDDVSEDEAETKPHVSVYTQEVPVLGRQRRSSVETYDCRQGDGETRCCRYPLWISFKDIGWDEWVVQPAGYQAYFCDGTCPHRYKVAHNFAGIKSLINLVNPAAAPPPCCTASKLSAITLLHYNHDGQMVVTVYEDMVVEECKCA